MTNDDLLIFNAQVFIPLVCGLIFHTVLMLLLCTACYKRFFVQIATPSSSGSKERKRRTNANFSGIDSAAETTSAESAKQEQLKVPDIAHMYNIEAGT